MKQYIDKDALVAELEKRRSKNAKNKLNLAASFEDNYLLSFIDTLEVIDPYEQCVQYDSIKAGIQAHAETYSFNIESELFNQLTPEQQKLWRKEIEQACISGGEMGVELARDIRYKENLEVKEVDNEQLNRLLNWWKEVTTEHSAYKAKEVDLDKELNKYFLTNNLIAADIQFEPVTQMKNCAKYFFELGISVGNKTNKIE